MVKRKGIIIGILIGLVGICFMPLSQNIDIVLDGKEYRIGNSEYEEDRTIEIQGKYKDYLFRDDTFEGKINIGGYNFLDKYDETNFTVVDEVASLRYYGVDQGRTIITSFGAMAFSNNFKEVLICVDEPASESSSKSWTSENGLFIVAPATNHELDLLLAKKLSKKSDWLSGVKWK
jgi:hypothetical protein